MAKKKLQQKKQKIVLLLDESGSMKDTEDITMSGVNEYVQSLVIAGKQGEFTLVVFNHNRVKTLWDNLQLADVPKLTSKEYKPIDGTPLYDAIGKTITNLESTVDDKTEVLFIIFTDGLENDSKEYTKQTIMNMIAQRQEKKWLFVFLGANQDSWASSAGLGIRNAQTNSSNYQPEAADVAFASLGHATIDYMSDPETSRRRGLFSK